ncbi:MAG: 50S ribosome-binding GTPase [Candidatus Sumerlaeia bacterium]|nr:50S ribosome-binding GTPase [Candidatus Sumerlaeia bacterium]
MSAKYANAGITTSLGDFKSCLAETDLNCHGEVSTAFDELEELVGTFMVRPKIVVFGMLKQGKSTLINALLDGDRENPCRTGAARMTVKEEEFPLCDGRLLIVDTPGTDSDEADNDLAVRLTKSASIILFIHSIDNGEYQLGELDFLNMLGKLIPLSEDRRRQIIPVFTKSDRKHNHGDRAKIIETCLKQYKLVIKVEPKYYSCNSAERYFAGREEERPQLIQLSEIPTLRSYLESIENKVLDNSHKRLVTSARCKVETILNQLKEEETRIIEEAIEKVSSIEDDQIKTNRLLNELFDAHTKEIKLCNRGGG